VAGLTAWRWRVSGLRLFDVDAEVRAALDREF
jgi:hypothetical protein